MSEMTSEQAAEVERVAAEIYRDAHYTHPWDVCSQNRRQWFIDKAERWLDPIFAKDREIQSLHQQIEQMQATIKAQSEAACVSDAKIEELENFCRAWKSEHLQMSSKLARYKGAEAGTYVDNADDAYQRGIEDGQYVVRRWQEMRAELERDRDMAGLMARELMAQVKTAEARAGYLKKAFDYVNARLDNVCETLNDRVDTAVEVTQSPPPAAGEAQGAASPQGRSFGEVIGMFMGNREMESLPGETPIAVCWAAQGRAKP
jgi:seryl-tRNA synthetase